MDAASQVASCGCDIGATANITGAATSSARHASKTSLSTDAARCRPSSRQVAFQTGPIDQTWLAVGWHLSSCNIGDGFRRQLSPELLLTSWWRDTYRETHRQVSLIKFNVTRDSLGMSPPRTRLPTRTFHPPSTFVEFQKRNTICFMVARILQRRDTKSYVVSFYVLFHVQVSNTLSKWSSSNNNMTDLTDTLWRNRVCVIDLYNWTWCRDVVDKIGAGSVKSLGKIDREIEIGCVDRQINFVGLWRSLAPVAGTKCPYTSTAGHMCERWHVSTVCQCLLQQATARKMSFPKYTTGGWIFGWCCQNALF